MSTYIRINQDDTYEVIEHLAVIEDVATDEDEDESYIIKNIIGGVRYTSSDDRDWERYEENDEVYGLSEHDLLGDDHSTIYCVDEDRGVVNIYHFVFSDFFTSRGVEDASDETKVRDYFLGYLKEYVR